MVGAGHAELAAKLSAMAPGEADAEVRLPRSFLLATYSAQTLLVKRTTSCLTGSAVAVGKDKNTMWWLTAADGAAAGALGRAGPAAVLPDQAAGRGAGGRAPRPPGARRARAPDHRRRDRGAPRARLHRQQGRRDRRGARHRHRRAGGVPARVRVRVTLTLTLD